MAQAIRYYNHRLVSIVMDMMEFRAGDFVARRLQLDPADDSLAAGAHAIWKSHLLLGKLAAHKHFFTDYTRGCSGECSGFCKDLVSGCKIVKHRVVAALLAGNALVWEVWRQPSGAAGPVDFCGILRLSEVEPGCDGLAHYCFFDKHLGDKTALLQAWKTWAFTEHPGWIPLNRVSIEFPETHYALGKHAMKHLGFGGPFEYKDLKVEGVKQAAKVLDSKPINMLIMGCLNGIRR